MAKYQLTSSEVVIRKSDGASVPNDPLNRDRSDYNAWVKAGGVPDPYIPPPASDALDAWDIITLKIAFNHENRMRALEGKASITLAQFKTAVKALI